MNERSGRGGGNRGGNQQQMSQNEVMSVGERLRAVLDALNKRGEELAGVLPKDLPLAAFLANVNQALRANPKLLNCTFQSIVDACVKAAYDGLRIDGKEAAIVDAKERYKDGSTWRERDVARYMPMVYGLIKQILSAGAALTVKAVMVYKNEAQTGRFVLFEGTTPGIKHHPFVEGEDRGPMIGVYAIAEVTRGVFKFEWMDAAAVNDVRQEAKTAKVWDRWPTEMWKKTAIRRLRKSLAGTSLIRDMEAAAMFPQYDRETPHHQMAALPSYIPAATPRPERALEHFGNESGVPLDLDRQDDREEMQEHRQERQEPQGNQQRQQTRQEPEQQQAEQKRGPVLPEDAQAWDMWAADFEKKVAAANTLEAVDALWAQEADVTKAAAKPLRERLTKAVTDRNTELALADTGQGAGGA